MSSSSNAAPTPNATVLALSSLICGSVAGALEIAITYPTEYIKTQLQLPKHRKLKASPITPTALSSGNPIPSPNVHSARLFTSAVRPENAVSLRHTVTAPGFVAPAKVTPGSVLIDTIKNKGAIALWTGVWPAIYGNALKAGVRFMFYDKLTSLFSNKETGRPSMGGTLAAGFFAGAAEALVVLQPIEGIRTKLIDDSNARKPRFNGSFFRAMSIIPREEGIKGIYRGWAPCAVRQGSSTAVRFGTYEIQKRWYKSRFGEDASGVMRFGMGCVAGAVTVYTTMPLDVVKTKMQSLSSRSLYKNSFHCFATIVREEGARGLWKGATPRLGRLVVSGGIIFSSYEWLWSFVNPAVQTYVG